MIKEIIDFKIMGWLVFDISNLNWAIPALLITLFIRSIVLVLKDRQKSIDKE